MIADVDVINVTKALNFQRLQLDYFSYYMSLFTVTPRTSITEVLQLSPALGP